MNALWLWIFAAGLVVIYFLVAAMVIWSMRAMNKMKEDFELPGK